MPDAIHLLAPGWLLLLLPALVVLWLLWHRPADRGAWSRVIDARLQPYLLGTHPGQHPTRVIGLLALAWLLGVLALTNPAWERKPQPLLAGGASRVVVLELSRSMFTDDVGPSRLIRARLKVEDLIDSGSTGQNGLVVYAGDAFTVTPLTRDADTLRALLRVLEPAIMPVQGSRLDLALAQAHRLLQQSGVERGDVIVIADGADDGAIPVATELLDAGHRVSVLGVGVPGQAVSRRGTGFDAASLAAIAEAGGGRYVTLSADASDIRELLGAGRDASFDPMADESQAEVWQGRGPLLVLFLLPLAALAFRRGWLMVWAAAAVVYLPPPPAFASTWGDLWLRPDQQAAQALADGDYARAASAATDPLVRGAAAYRQGRYQMALDAFRQSDGAEGAYNQGNTLARLGRYRAAVEAYDRALSLDPSMDDAAFNKRLVERLLAQRDQPESNGDRPQAKAEAEPESSRSETEPQSDDADASSASAEGSPSDQGSDDGQTTAAQEADQGDRQAGDREGDETAQATPSESDSGDTSGEPASAGNQQTTGEQSSSEPAAGRGQDDMQSQGQLADTSTDQGGVESGDQVTDRGGQDDVGEGRTTDASAESPGREDDDADEVHGTGKPAPDPSGEAGHVASAETEQSGTETDEGRSQQATAMPDQSSLDPGQSDDRPLTDAGQSFAEANRRLAERQQAGSEGAGDLPETETSKTAPGRDANAPAGPGTGDDPRQRPGPAPAATEWTTEERLAAEQWLRRIPDDPGGLLRRKFLFQYRERQRAIDGNGQPPR